MMEKLSFRSVMSQLVKCLASITPHQTCSRSTSSSTVFSTTKAWKRRSVQSMLLSSSSSRSRKQRNIWLLRLFLSARLVMMISHHSLRPKIGLLQPFRDKQFLASMTKTLRHLKTICLSNLVMRRELTTSDICRNWFTWMVRLVK